MSIWYLNLIYELVKITTELRLTCQAEVLELPKQLFEHKQETLVTQEMRKVIKLKTQTIRPQSCRFYLRLNNFRLYGGMMKLGGYSIGIAQIDDEIKENLNFRICPISTISLLVSRSDMPNMRCFSIDGMKNQHDAHSLTVNNLLSSLLFSLTLKTLKFLLLPSSIFEITLSQDFDLVAKSLSPEIFLSRIMT